ncbi:MAG: M14 family metallopeptidase [Bacteroidota bacterium]
MNKYILLLIISVVVACSTSKKVSAPLNYDPPGSTNTKTKPIEKQVKSIRSINGVTVDNTFPGARLNDFIQINDSLYQVIISPENKPINLSPWYSFKIKSESKKQIYLHLKYTFGKHRYYPDYSTNGKEWYPLDSTRYHIYENDSTVFQLNLDQNELWISAQELMTSEDNDDWIKSIENNPEISVQSYGESREGRSLKALSIGLKKKQPTLVVMGRQHPPEVPGYMAMQAFVGELFATNDLSNKFRSKFTILLLPMINPDGVDNGHWRHNAGGVDLNRDWQFFNQPEVDLLQHYIKTVVKKNKLNIVLGLDFHSTQYDLLYTFNNETFPENKGVVKAWIRQLRTSLPNDKIAEEDGGAEAPVSKNWFLNEFKAEGVTYEVGDDTPREYLKLKGKRSAQILMELLLEKYTD